MSDAFPDGQPPGPGGDGHKGRWTGLVGGAVVVVAALLVTGLVAPGWMLSPGNSPKAVAEKAADALANENIAEGNAISCKKLSDTQVRREQARVDGTKSKATLSGEPKVNGATATVDVHLEAISGPHVGDERTVTIAMRKQDGDWCVSRLDKKTTEEPNSGGGTSRGGTGAAGATGSVGGTAPASNAKDAITRFVSAVNSGNASAAMHLLCPGVAASVKSTITKVTSKGTRVAIDSSRSVTLSTDSGFGAAALKATGGEKGTGNVLSHSGVGGHGACVASFTFLTF